jgi:multicomponent Na+:H+ antiporter subunit D
MTGIQYPIFIVITPLLAAFFAGLLGIFNRKLSFPIALLAMTISLGCALRTIFTVLKTGVIHYYIGGWIPPFGIEYTIDHLNALVLVVVSFSGFINVIYSKRSIEQDLPDKIPQFYTLYLLLLTGLLGITITGDAFNLYVLLEISALTAYTLIALGSGRALLASYNYLIMGTIGACFYLLGVGHLYIVTGSLNMADLHKILPALSSNNSVLVAFILMLAGIWVKMAFFPAHGWLPNAYTYAPTASSSLLAPTMTKVSVYIMIRIMFSVFSPEFTFSNAIWQDVIIWCAVIAIVGGSLQALAQRDFKRMLTYLIIAEVGYMVGGVWIGNELGITGAILHILNDAMMMLCMFFVAGIINYKFKSHNFDSFQGLFRKMPLTMAIFVIGVLSMIGVPPTCGFFSKWYLILAAVEAGKWHFMIGLIFSSLINVILFFRIIEIAYYPSNAEGHGHGHGDDHTRISEAPISMLAPLVIVGICLILIGVYSGEIVSNVIQYAVPAGIGN